MKENNKKKIKFPVMVIPIIAIALILSIVITISIVNKKKSKQSAVIPQEIQPKKEIIDQLHEDDKTKLKRYEEENTTEEYKEYEKLSEEKKKQVEVIPRKEKIKYEEIEVIKETQKENLGKEYVELNNSEQEDEKTEVLPERFNLADKIDIKVENQGQFGLCWIFSGLSAIETNLALTQNKNYDLSESYIDYMMSSDLINWGMRQENSGGNFQTLCKYNEVDRGFALEENIPLNVYEEYEYNTFYNVPTEDIYITKVVEFPNPGQYGISEEEKNRIDNVRTAAKTHIMNYGSLCATIYGPKYGTNHFIKNKEEIGGASSNHMVSLVGWDDNYSKENFTSPGGSKPQNDGAFIALNSWGADWGDKGYFYISYEDYYVYTELAGIVSVNNFDDLINLSTLSNQNVAKYIKNSFPDNIVNKNGVEYFAKGGSKVSSLNLSNMGITSINEIIDFIKLCRPVSIDLSNNEIENIDGLEKYISHCSVLNLSNNKIKDVSNLKNLDLSELNLDNNLGIKGYEQCTSVRDLSISNCGVSNIDNLENLKKLQALNISQNEIDTYEVLSKLEKLRDLDISQNNLKSLKDIENLNLYVLDLSGNNQIKDYTPVRKMSTLCEINLTNCDIKDANDILIETEMNNQDEGDEDVCEVTYILSKNKNINNLGVLKNAYEIRLIDCDLQDISDLKQLDYLRNIDLSDNTKLTGDLSNKSYDTITLNNCNISNDFDFFNLSYSNVIRLLNNNITDFSTINKKVVASEFQVDEKQYQNMKNKDIEKIKAVNDEYKVISVIKSITIKIPNSDNLELNVGKFAKSLRTGSTMYFNGNRINKRDLFVKIDKDSIITYRDYTGVTEIKFSVADDCKNEVLIVTKNPTNLSYLADSIDTTGMEVAKLYHGYLYEITDDYEIDTNVKTLPGRVVQRTYSDGENGSIFVPEKYYFEIKKDDIIAKCTATKYISREAGIYRMVNNNERQNNNTISNNTIYQNNYYSNNMISDNNVMTNTVTNNVVGNNVISNNTTGNNIINQNTTNNTNNGKIVESQNYDNYLIEVYEDSTIKIYFKKNNNMTLVDTFKSNIPSYVLGSQVFGYGYYAEWNNDGEKKLRVRIDDYADFDNNKKWYYYDENGNKIE